MIDGQKRSREQEPQPGLEVKLEEEQEQGWRNLDSSKSERQCRAAAAQTPGSAGEIMDALSLSLYFSPPISLHVSSMSLYLLSTDEELRKKVSSTLFFLKTSL